ncbi:MAG: class I SAM-dependent methyltransferase [Patescibacteria group bacterium]|nr:class I SAM-dependent methyltransferase [Patescibacteria group bacterium]
MSQKFQDIVEKSYDSVAEDWSKTRKNLHWEDFDWMYEAAPCSSERDKILDLGCGTGRLFDFLESKGCVYQQYTGVDLSKNMLQQAQKHYPKNRYVQGSMLSIPVTDTGSIDQVWCIAAFHHLGSRQERLEALMEISRVLKPG